MNLKTCFKAKDQSFQTSLGLLILRLVAGLAFILHGWGKIQNPLAWMGPDAPVPGALQFLAALSEFGGGIAWMLGLLVPLASLGIFFTMLVATSMHMFVMGDPFVSTGGSSYELASIYFCISVLLILAGPGKFSVDAKFFGETRG